MTLGPNASQDSQHRSSNILVCLRAHAKGVAMITNVLPQQILNFQHFLEENGK